MTSWQEYLRFAVTLTAVLDPFLAVPIFVSVTAGQDMRERLRLAQIVTVTVFAVLAGAAILGERLLRFIGASLPAFQVGGGLVLLLMSLAMLNAKVGEMRQTRAEARELEAREYSGVVPLAVPLLAGPGAIGTTIIAAQPGGVAHGAVLVVCIALVCALLWAMLRQGGFGKFVHLGLQRLEGARWVPHRFEDRAGAAFETSEASSAAFVR